MDAFLNDLYFLMIPTPTKLFFPAPLPLETPELSVHGIGLMEKMRPGIVDRSQGTRDFLFMYFYKPVSVKLEDAVIQTDAPCLMIWDPKHGHYYGRVDRTWSHSWCHCSGKLPERELPALCIPLNRPIYGDLGDLFENFIIELHHELRAYHHPDPDIIHTLVRLFFRKLRRIASPQKPSPPEGILKARRCIENLFHTQLELTTLAKNSGYSIPHFSKLFHSHFGISPCRYALQLRIQRAELLLRNKNLKMKNIAEECGFYDVYSFSKLFKKYRGVPPLEWKKNQIHQ